MFKLEENHTYRWPVDVKVPVDGGKIETQRFTAVFRTLGISAAMNILAEIRTAGDQSETLTEQQLDKLNDLIRSVWVGWGDDVCDEDGAKLEFSDENRDRMLNVRYVLDAVNRAYQDSIEGRKAQRKN